MKRISLFLLGFLSSFIFSKTNDLQLNVIPQPQEIEFGKGFCKLNQKTKILYCGNDEIRKLAFDFSNYINTSIGLESEVKESSKNDTKSIFLELSSKTIDKIGLEGYLLDIKKESISIRANNKAGLFYGIVSLKQILQTNKKIPIAKITDYPRFSYRGMHLDVSRSFYKKDFIKKYLDYLAMFKMNTFHWHLTDGAGWRLQIDKYPELTEIAAFRTHQTWKEFWNGGRHFSCANAPDVSGGYYTKEDVKEILKYAAERNITVIPEIEMPGHSEEVLAVYPELSCSGKPYKNGEFCIGNDTTFIFLENVLSEVINLFPSKYVHIGGDEAGKDSWKQCPKCQKRIKDNNLKDEHELQSYLIKRIEKFLNSKGRSMMGWDEILEGGLAPNATVMSWRGVQGGIDAAKQGHDVVMTPGSPLYFDHYQDDPQSQPEAFGGLNTLRDVYSYEPIPKELNETEAKYVLGAQANLWSEYIPTTSHVEYMIMPRMVALSEAVWSKKEDKDWDSFISRIKNQLPIWDSMKINYCKPSTRIDFISQVDSINKKVKVNFVTDFYKSIHYTTDGTEPTLNSSEYKNSISVNDSTRFTVALFDNNKIISKPVSRTYGYHKAIGGSITYNLPHCPRYPAQGIKNLIDSKIGGGGYNDKIWQGFTNDVDITIDMKQEKDISSVAANFMQLTGPGIYMPEYVEIQGAGEDKIFEKLATVSNDIPKSYSFQKIKTFKAIFETTKARYIRFFAKNAQKGYVFTDEIIVY